MTKQHNIHYIYKNIFLIFLEFNIGIKIRKYYKHYSKTQWTLFDL